MKFLVNDVNYHVEVCGRGFPLVLLHGFTGDSSTWTHFCEQLGKHSQLIIPDIIGHGKTDLPDDSQRYSIEAAAQDLSLILDQLGIRQIDLLGYSMGGRLALTFAVLFPERVRKLILESSSPGLLSVEERKQRRDKDAVLAHFIIKKGMEQFVDYWEEIPLFASMKQLPQAARERVRKQRLANSPKGLANSLLYMGTGSQPSWWERLETLKCEVLLITGEKDQKFCGIAEKMITRLKKAIWVSVPNTGHAIHVEDCEKFVTIVSDFLSIEKK
ncbi:2-succinyl-6-hydroxy-2,4-cyclohexadiene-1-carboxylate synthase [Neobacillus sp. YIM B02564]|jgi:2-succinyl-6-hydroxy-2,4-cyclohexadiene-1-carboxylate synthase|uniref:Putative 2-succinyl-6-hydroxy-2,4-cyclohexadiene-1-carboxylate synthase n=1 Tax=Neobacillus paridis TaxID=2803862 RepID=A0ABS1TKN6_9BACI|nr:2-succinyl-6-hydroxy-2,4-cyclohexadiene-1-carboxylate synthase [Neobacillus paridis]MBL4951875.1 2-succinyl-6-hydroxy-2,4-cyclohexadiene-1-carboxylate synthase [Neobacillus paridis]